VGGKPKDPAYFRNWRAAHPAYRARETAAKRERRRLFGRGDRSVEYARRNASRQHAPAEPLPALFPDLVRGNRIAFWEEELAADLRQEAALAVLEGRDPEEAVRAYRARERGWHYRLATDQAGDVDLRSAPSGE
jgi:hypothetical protein